MNYLCEKQVCTGCSACYQVCRVKAIKMINDNNGFSFPKVDNEKCIACGACSKACHILNPIDTKSPSSYYTFYGPDSERKKSSSGAFFPAIAKALLKEGYNIVGVVFSNDYLSAKYIVTKSEKQVDRMRKSKYIEADLGDIYGEVNRLLCKGEKVFFTGLPCHVAGLLKYVKKTENLITMDLLCFGVGAPSIYVNSLKFFLSQKKEKTEDLVIVDFRHKPFIHYSHTVLDIVTKNNNYVVSAEDFPYYYGFVHCLIHRESCYSCRYNSIERCTDITIGDTMGHNDPLGRNVVFCNTPLGEHIVGTLIGEYQLSKMNNDEIEANKARFRMRKKPDNYDRIMRRKDLKYLKRQQLTNKRVLDAFRRRALRLFGRT